MPVTAKLSRKFYETFGDEIANELVNWFNQVDLTYRTELKELNELNFARFDAKVEQRFTESDAKLEQRFTEADAKVERRFTEWNAKLERRLAQLEAKVEQCFAKAEAEQRFTQFEARWTDFEGRVVRQFARFESQLGELKADLATSQTVQTRWIVGLWATLALAIIGLYRFGGH